jgi:hypothetical protein
MNGFLGNKIIERILVLMSLWQSKFWVEVPSTAKEMQLPARKQFS